MSVFEKASEVVTQIAGFATVPLTDALGSVFMLFVMFFLDLLLGL